MAKDVDLSSKEWRDIIFEGKNKDFGAYQLRKGSVSRHNRAMIVIVIVIAILFALAFLVNTVIKSAEARPEDTIEQAMAEMITDEVDEEPEEDEPQRIEEQKPEVIKEELLNTTKAAEILVVPDEEVKEEIKSQDDLKDDDRAIGAVNEDRGVDDIINAQEHKDVVVGEEKVEPKEEQVFDAVEQDPQFPGGTKAIAEYFNKNLVYPPIAAEQGIQGVVHVRFVVRKDGKVDKAHVLRSKDPELDKEAVRVVSKMPNWIPGKMNGHSVNVWYTVPVRFRLANQ